MPSEFETFNRLRPLTGTPSVLLLHPEAAVRERWSTRLQGYQVHQASTWNDAQAKLKASEVHVLICPWPWSRDHLPELGRADELRVLYVGNELPDEVVEDAAAGQRVAFARREETLFEKVFELTWPLREDEHRHPVSGLVVTLGGAKRSNPVLDLSCGGFAFELTSDEPIEPYLPGTFLEELRFSRGGSECFKDAWGEVRHVSVSDRGYRVGCTLLPRFGDAQAGVAWIQDPAQCAAVMRRAFRHSGLRLSLEGESTGELVAKTGTLRLSSAELILDVRASPFAAFDVVQGRFDLGSVAYQFVTTVLEARPALRIRLPGQIQELRRRRMERRPLASSLRGRFRSAIAAGPVDCEVADLNTVGCSIAVKSPAPLPPGLLLDEVTVKLGEATLRSRAVVRNSSFNERDGTRCGLEFLELDDARRLLLANYVVRERLPQLQDGRDAKFEDLVDLFVRTGLVKAEQVELMRPHFPVICRTVDNLGRAPANMFRSLVMSEGERLVGHVSVVRVYEKTWFIQQLAVEPGTPLGAYALNMGAAEFFEQCNDVEYAKIAFFSDNKWPVRVFGRFARRVGDPRMSLLRSLVSGLLHSEAQRHQFLPAPGVSVREASSEDLALIERYFVRNRPDILLRSDDLTKGRLLLSGLGKAYEQLGVLRGRKALVARIADKPVAFALIDLCSQGYNFFEYFNAARVHFVESLELQGRQEVRSALLREAAGIFGGIGLPYGRVFFRSNEVQEYADLGIPSGRRVLEWTCHRSQFRRFTDHVDTLFEALVARRQSAARRHGKETPPASQ